MSSNKGSLKNNRFKGQVFVPHRFLSTLLKRGSIILPDLGMGVVMKNSEFRSRLEEGSVSSEVVRQGAFRIL